MPTEIHCEPPPKCRACNFEPVKRNNEKQEINLENEWIYCNIPGTVVHLYFCPKCGFIMSQDNLIECVKIIKAAREKKIVEYSGARIVGPGRKVN